MKKFLLFGGCVFCCGVCCLAQQTPEPLTLAQAEQLALHNNPHLASSRLLALAESQITRQERSAEFPQITGNLTAVDAHANSRITAGALNNPTVYERAAAGASLSQLITDFGRTRALVRSASERANAAESTATATAQDITLAVDDAYFRALGTVAVLQVANATVAARQATVDQVQALAKAGLKSDLDLNFAQVNLAQARLLVLDAENAQQAAMADLNSLLGDASMRTYALQEDTNAALPLPPESAEALVELAFQARPDLRSLEQQFAAARSFATAERDLKLPSVSALAAGGGTPVRADQITSSWYGAAGVNLEVPVFNGGLYSARAKEAELRAQSVSKDVEDLRNGIARDVRTTALQAQQNYQRIAVAQQLLAEATSALRLAQARYKLGLSSIVELSQAQLAATQAQIDSTNARYTYQASLAALRFETGQ